MNFFNSIVTGGESGTGPIFVSGIRAGAFRMWFFIRQPRGACDGWSCRRYAPEPNGDRDKKIDGSVIHSGSKSL
jgi:hypothetical protein